MKARRLAVLALALVTVVTMGIGYATLNDALQINGTGSLEKTAADELFDGEVYFVGTPEVDKCTATLEAGEKPDEATIAIENTLAIVGDSASAIFEVQNDSTVPVTITVNTNTANTKDSEHFRVTASYLDNQGNPSPNGSVAAGETIKIVVTVKLTKTVDVDVDGEVFAIGFNVTSAG